MSFWRGILAGLGVVLVIGLGFYFVTRDEGKEKTTDTYGYTIDTTDINTIIPTEATSIDSPSNETSMRTLPEQQDLAKEYSGAILHTAKGDITVSLYRDESPITVNNFLNLAEKKFYDGTTFHRVIPDFMIQGGDPLSRDAAQRRMHGTGGPGYKFGDEFNTKPLVRGSLAMANSGPNTNGSQFFIVTAESTPWLDGRHVNFGMVTAGMDVVMAISGVARDVNDNPTEPITITSIELVK